MVLSRAISRRRPSARAIVRGDGGWSVGADSARARGAKSLVDALTRGRRDDIDGVRVIELNHKIPRELTRAHTASSSGFLRDSCHWRKKALPKFGFCEIDGRRRGRRHKSRRAQEFLAMLFQLVSKCSEGKISLNRFDLFHGHVFVASATNTLGILFHAKEYPAYDDKTFPYDLGYCQQGSTLRYDEAEASTRNVIWLALADDGTEASVLAYIDTSSPAYRDILTVPELHTTYEGDFGRVQGDIYYFDSLRNRRVSERLFIVPR